MDGIGIGYLGGTEDPRDIPVALVTRGWTDANIFVCKSDM
jgi:hypothetical protein